MKRLFVLAALCVGALMLVGEAPATTRDTDTQELLVVPFNTAPGAQTDTDIEVYVPPTDAATAKVSIYAPTGYGVNTSLAPGTKIGDIEGAVNIKQLGTNVDVTGTLTTDDPAKYATDPNAQACAPGTHAAVWVASIGASGQTINIPIFVDPTTGTDTALGGYVMQACLLSPDVDPTAGGAPLGAKLVYLDLQTTGLITNPAAQGTPEWRAFVTAYTPGTGTVDPASTVEIRCETPLPQRIIGLKIKYTKKPKHVTKVAISGTVEAGGAPRAGVVVHILNFTTAKPWATAKTNAAGKFSLVKPLPKKLLAFMFVEVTSSTTCSSIPSPAPKGCVREDVAPEIGPFKVLTPRKT